MPSNSKTLCNAVRIANDLNTESIPKTMFRDNIEIQSSKFPDSFAGFFNHKVKNIAESTNIDYNVYNGLRKVEAENKST